MVILLALIGLTAGYGLHYLGDLLPRVAGYPAGRRPTACRPALLEIVSGRAPRQSALIADVAVELLSAIVLPIIWLWEGLSWRGAALAGGFGFLALISLIDLKHHLILNMVVYPALVVVLLGAFLFPEHLLSSLLGGLVAFIIFSGTAFLRPGTLGGGDIKLAILIGLSFGFPNLLWPLLAGAGLGGMIALALLSRGQTRQVQFVPYAPFLCAGVFAYQLWNMLP